MTKKKVVKPRIKTLINDEMVLAYLTDNPNFFMRNANQVDSLQVPHAIHGTVSLVEWQLKRQRERILKLEEEITALFETAYQNEHLFNQLLNLILSLSIADDLTDFSNRLGSWTRKLGLTHVDIRLFTDVWNVAPPFEKTDWGIERERFESLRINKLSQTRHFLGQLNPTELNLVLTQRVLVGSVALSLLDIPVDEETLRYDKKYHNKNTTKTKSCSQNGETSSSLMNHEKNSASGIILFVSPNENHFQKDLDTALLTKLCQLIPRLLTKWVALK